MENRCPGCDLEKWVCVSYLTHGEAESHSAPSAACSAGGPLGGFVSVALALRTKPQQEAKLVNLATDQLHGDQSTQLGCGPKLVKCSGICWLAGSLMFPEQNSTILFTFCSFLRKEIKFYISENCIFFFFFKIWDL